MESGRNIGNVDVHVAGVAAGVCPERVCVIEDGGWKFSHHEKGGWELSEEAGREEVNSVREESEVGEALFIYYRRRWVGKTRRPAPH